ncbi:putative hydrolase [Gordonia polyisoprenivorans VH2]|uniref:Putative hydrolase n=1 Tax=Gordonia polyisoprenivorans (strain DSM 44266 / VH2) TaxID=1112204 RepID=H6N225_GORPV|nr:HAD-IA family hydrolase [Gordonia polyisoprenivorans]AFA75897.1 putative hydrolase [Gordonia polyisoprenivorans VH2]
MTVPAIVDIAPHTPASKYSAVFLDFGGVLSPPIEDLFTEYERKTGIAPSDLKAAMAGVADRLGVDVLAPVELGMLTEQEWVQGLHTWLTARNIDVSRSELEFGRQWFAGHEVNSVIRDLAVQLRGSGYRVGILTNNVREWEPYWRPMVGLDDEVDVIVDSYAVRLRKPDPEIFALAAERIGVPGTKVILVDDLRVNCDAAENAGWGAVQFVETSSALADLARLLTTTSEGGS